MRSGPAGPAYWRAYRPPRCRRRPREPATRGARPHGLAPWGAKGWSSRRATGARQSPRRSAHRPLGPPALSFGLRCHLAPSVLSHPFLPHGASPWGPAVEPQPSLPHGIGWPRPHGLAPWGAKGWSSRRATGARQSPRRSAHRPLGPPALSFGLRCIRKRAVGAFATFPPPRGKPVGAGGDDGPAIRRRESGVRSPGPHRPLRVGLHRWRSGPGSGAYGIGGSPARTIRLETAAMPCSSASFPRRRAASEPSRCSSATSARQAA